MNIAIQVSPKSDIFHSKSFSFSLTSALSKKNKNFQKMVTRDEKMPDLWDHVPEKNTLSFWDVVP